uniref:FERM domain-containing protein n=1 Tax=Echinococcus canadensis TaxID=519352 RepID=A0A915EVU0_9CEST
MTSTSTSKSTTRSSRRGADDGLQVTVSLLENDCFITIWVPEQASGRWLLEEVCKKQAVLPEIEYFGLRYISCELLSSPSKHWMNPVKPVRPQLKHTNPLMVSFRIKHYPPDPFSDFKLDKSKYLLFHQLHRDFLSGRLIAPHKDLIRLAAFFIQVTLGDASEMAASMPSLQSPSASTRTDSSTYLSNYRALHNTSSKKNELEILEEHRKLEGVLPSEAAAEAIRIALRQPSYGLEPFKVRLTKRKDSRPVHIGLTHEGVAEFLGSKRAHLFKWAEIDQFFYSGKNFIIRHQKAASKRQKSAHEITEYKCESRAIASELWSWALERKLFFTKVIYREANHNEVQVFLAPTHLYFCIVCRCDGFVLLSNQLSACELASGTHQHGLESAKINTTRAFIVLMRSYLLGHDTTTLFLLNLRITGIKIWQLIRFISTLFNNYKAVKFSQEDGYSPFRLHIYPTFSQNFEIIALNVDFTYENLAKDALNVVKITGHFKSCWVV